MSFQNKTAFITGASRGIGKAIALRLAKEGANIVVAAKSVEEHPKLGGTIYSAAQEIEEAGGKALAVQVDIRNEDEIKKAVDETINVFGSIDILVNNASAIQLTNTEQTPAKRFDLMFDINVLGKVLSDVDIYINEENVYRPDIFFISNEQMDILGDDGYVHGAPDLVIEVLSKGTERYDKTRKKEIYAQYGVKEYWLVHPKTKHCTGYINENNIFKPIPVSQNRFHIQLLDLEINL